ncbi:MAG: Gldg family protein [Planctomycetota bacterium]
MKTMINRSSSNAGYVQEVFLRVILLLAVLGQLVFLASRYRTRVDVTEDQLYSLTPSTRQVLEGLDDRLLVEAYFSKESRLPGPYREFRRDLDNFLDECVQLSDGKLVIQRLDPQDDAMVREKATRLGIQAVSVSDTSGESALAIKEIWQGLRMMYGADKQEVIPFLSFVDEAGRPRTTYQYEAEFTPKIKALTVLEKTKVGVLAFATEGGAPNPMMPGSGGTAKGFTKLGEIEGVKGRYELANVDMSQGQLVPEDMSSLLLIRPKNLTDRQKYAIDQFVMRGGKLVVFADTNEYEVGQQRTFRGRKVNYDATDSQLKFLDQLKHYGVDVQDKLVSDALPDADGAYPFVFGRRHPLGFVQAVQLQYPYWFRPLPLNYSELADRFVTGANGDTAELVDRYRKTFMSGMDTDHQLLSGMTQGPGLFWACPVDLADPLPDGVEGRVLMRTSPMAYLEDPPLDLNPLGFSRNDPAAQNESILQFNDRISQKVESEPRQQFGLMVEVSGKFTSFFKGKDIPPRRKEDVASAAPGAAPDPLVEPIQQLPVTAPAAVPAAEKTEAGGDGADGGAGQDPQNPTETEAQEPAPATEKAEGAEGETQEPQTQEPQTQEPQTQEPAVQAPALEGPAAPMPEAPVEEEDPDPIFEAQGLPQITVIGDSDFVRDDLIEGEYARAGGPFSQLGPVFIGNLMDALGEDSDLLALRNKARPDRRMQFIERDPRMGLEEQQQLVKSRTQWLQWLNIGGPFVAIMVIWLLFGMRRRARKASFLASVQR